MFRVMDLCGTRGLQHERGSSRTNVFVYDDPNHAADPEASHDHVRREVRNLGVPGADPSVTGIYSRQELKDDGVRNSDIKALFAAGVPESRRRWHAKLIAVPGYPKGTMSTAVWYLADFSKKLYKPDTTHPNYYARYNPETGDLDFFPALTERVPDPDAKPVNTWKRLASVDIKGRSEVSWACGNLLG